MKDLTAVLPDGREFAFWEQETVYTRELHVNPNAVNASDDNDGSNEKPFRTINAAAQVATPKTRVRIHGGVYRETVQPAMSGDGPDAMISYEPYGDGEVIIKASVVATEFARSTEWNLWRRFMGEVPKGERVIWVTELNPEDFKGYNPFCAVNILHDRLFIEYDRTDMTTYLNRRGMVFVDGKPMKQVSLFNHMAKEDNTYWVEANGQKVHFRLKNDDDPRNHVIELTSREQCFAPKIPFISYIRVSGMTMAHAATGAPVPQRGSISCYRGHNWIIENCFIDWSNGVGIDCGNECWHHTMIEDLIKGNHVIRGNTISDVGVCGIAGMGSENLLIEDNLITGTGWQAMELSWEAGGIKLHNMVNGLIRRNIIRDCFRCDSLWLDVGNLNNRITCNLFLDGKEMREHIFLECMRDSENLLDNNIIWGVEGRYDRNNVPTAPGGASASWYMTHELGHVNGYGVYLEGTDEIRMVNNLIGNCNSAGFFAKTVAFRIWNGRGGTSRDNMFFNNVFYGCGEAAIKLPTKDNKVEGNVYAKMPPMGGYARVLYPEPTMCLDVASWRKFFGFDVTGAESKMSITIDSDALVMEINLPEDMPVNSSDDKVACDFYGEPVESNRVAGPFTNVQKGKVSINIDPRKKA